MEFCARDEKRNGEDAKEGSITSARGPNLNPDRGGQLTRHHQRMSPSHDTNLEGCAI
jgi:hypothetical protein